MFAIMVLCNEFSNYICMHVSVPTQYDVQRYHLECNVVHGFMGTRILYITSHLVRLLVTVGSTQLWEIELVEVFT